MFNTEENKNKEKYPYSDFVIGNKWIYRGAQKHQASPLGNNRIQAAEMGAFGSAGWARTLGDLLGLGGGRFSPRVPHARPHTGTISRSPGLQSGAKLPRFQGLIAQEGPVRTLLSACPLFPDPVPEFSADKMIAP